MSAELAARTAILIALRADAPLLALVNRIADGDPVKASAPWLLVGAGQSTSWGARGVDGLAMRQSFQLRLRGDEVARVADIFDRVDLVLRAMSAELGDWRITSLTFERSRTRRTEGDWLIAFDYLLRMARLM